MTKNNALANAQTVFAWAVFGGHGSLHELINYGMMIELCVHFRYGKFIREREDVNFKRFAMAGAEFEWTDRPALQVWVLRITWHYSE
ncbi:MAG: hypothetical protein IJI83_05925 [Oscillospiraceae bacterium]|nr:hypothetical protein [Oscillospiraceae bacterium]